MAKREKRIRYLDTKSLMAAVFQKDIVVFCGFGKIDFDFDSDFDFEENN